MDAIDVLRSVRMYCYRFIISQRIPCSGINVAGDLIQYVVLQYQQCAVTSAVVRTLSIACTNK
jgi:hypothetical protein